MRERWGCCRSVTPLQGNRTRITPGGAAGATPECIIFTRITPGGVAGATPERIIFTRITPCLLYTSDAADE